jgi:tyrosine phenol-lyase
VYTQQHLAYVAEVVADLYVRRNQIRGLRMTYEPPTLRFFQARFEPVEATTRTTASPLAAAPA